MNDDSLVSSLNNKNKKKEIKIHERYDRVRIKIRKIRKNKEEEFVDDSFTINLSSLITNRRSELYSSRSIHYCLFTVLVTERKAPINIVIRQA